MNTWKQTFTGKAFDLLDPHAEDIRSTDIAHALSMLCRFTGHTRIFYSVAEHSILVSCYVAEVMGRPDLRLAALLHDAAEAYTGDRSTPMKVACARVLRRQALNLRTDPFDEIASRVDAAIHEAFDIAHALNAEAQAVIKQADLVLLATEAGHLLGVPPARWDLPYPPYRPYAGDWMGKSPAEAEKWFLDELSDIFGVGGVPC